MAWGKKYQGWKSEELNDRTRSRVQGPERGDDFSTSSGVVLCLPMSVIAGNGVEDETKMDDVLRRVTPCDRAKETVQVIIHTSSPLFPKEGAGEGTCAAVRLTTASVS